MAAHERLDRGDLDLVVFADQLPLVGGAERQMTVGAMRRRVILDRVRRVARSA